MDRSKWLAHGDAAVVAVLGMLLAAIASAGLAQPAEAPRAAPGQTPLAIPNCASPATIELRIGNDSAMLDGADQAALGAAMLERYPMLGRDGFSPAAIVLWRKPGADWLYVTLAKTPDSSAWCFTASFVAAHFEATAGLLRKYFFIGAART